MTRETIRRVTVLRWHQPSQNSTIDSYIPQMSLKKFDKRRVSRSVKMMAGVIHNTETNFIGQPCLKTRPPTSTELNKLRKKTFQSRRRRRIRPGIEFDRVFTLVASAWGLSSTPITHQLATCCRPPDSSGRRSSRRTRRRQRAPCRC